MRLFLVPAITALCLFAFSAQAAPERYEFDKSHTRILFFINHLGFSDTVGEFTLYDGNFTFDEEKPASSTVDVTLKPSGIRTPSSLLDSELQGEKFFNTDKFPDIRFVSNSVKITGEKTGDILGTLTMLGVSKPVTLKVVFNKADYHPYTQNYVAGFHGEAVIKRSEFGFNYLIPAVGDDVRLEVYTEGVNLDRKKKEAVQKK